MLENVSYTALQQYWWILVSLLGSILVFLLFVQGGQTFIYQFGKTDQKRSIIINAIGSKWEFTFTTLVTFGGAFFASFPLFYSTSFGGAYWVWLIILFAFVIQAVSYEFRSKAANFLGKKVFDSFLFVNGLLGTILLGAAVSTFFTGSHFVIDTNFHSTWTLPSKGLEAALNIQNLSLGLTVFFLSRVLALHYFLNTIDDEEILNMIKKQLWNNAIPFVIFFLTFSIMLLLKKGFAVNPESGEVYIQQYKYFLNLVEMPLVAVVFLSGVVLVLLGIIRSILFIEKYGEKAIWYTGLGTVLTVFSIFLLAGFNNTAYYPSVTDLQSSLTIKNSSSSHYTLKAMSYVSFIIPFVLIYIIYMWRAINSKKVNEEEISKEEHIY